MIQHAVKFFAIVILLTSCKQKNEDAQVNVLLTGFQNTDSVIRQSILALEMSFEERSKDAKYYYKTSIWYPKVQTINSLSSAIYTFIDSLNEKLAEKKVEKNKLRGLLFGRLIQYKNDLVNVINPDEFSENANFYDHLVKIKKDMYRELPLLPTISNLNNSSISQSSEDLWFDSHFENATPLMCQAILSKIKNDIRISQHTVLRFCDIHTSINDDSFDYFRAIATISSSSIRQGEPIVVTAGIGAFTADRNPKIRINGKNIDLAADAVAEYVFIPRGQPGKYSVPIEFEYGRPDGSRETVKKIIRYTIVQ